MKKKKEEGEENEAEGAIVKRVQVEGSWRSLAKRDGRKQCWWGRAWRE